MISDKTPLSEAKSFVESHKNEGVRCPCCAQYAKRYRRKITSAMAYGLLLIHKNSQGEWLHIEEFFKNQSDIPSSIRGDISKLRHWGLLEKNYAKSEDGNSNGLYRITSKGRAFVKGEITVPRYCYIFNDEVNGFSEEKATIQSALTDKFNYSELLPRTNEPMKQKELF